MSAKVVDLTQVKRNKKRKEITAMYIAFYGTTYDSARA